MTRLRSTRLVVLIPVLVVALATFYIGVLAVASGIEAANMRQTADSLAAEKDSADATVVNLLHDVDTLTREVEGNLDDVSATAHDRAAAEDDQILYGSISLAYGDCIRERDTLAGYVRSRSLYTPASMREYQNGVDGYCGEMRTIYVDLLEGVTS